MNPKDINKYLYINKTPTWLIRAIYGLGILCYLPVIYGYYLFINTSPFYTWFIFPIVIFFTVYYLNSYTINLFYKRPNLTKHLALVEAYWQNQKAPPSVDIFLPICGEAVSVLENTFKAVTNIPYENKKVYVLDDKGGDEYKQAAEKYGFTYMSRENKGEMKKAGNLKYGFERTNGEFIVIFDADFAPHPDFIKELVPYMQDEKVAIIQTPQYFDTSENTHKRSSLEYGAAHIQEDFYRSIQVARDQLGAPICCGSNALYRRKALEETGGTVQIEHSEDMYTGFELMTKGWKVRYLPIILAVGICPSNIHQYFHQQQRWCSGTLILMLDKNFWTSNLSFGQKMCFISGFMYYISYPLAIVLSFQVFLVLFYYQGDISLFSAIPFVPTILFSAIVLPLYRLSEPRIGNFLARTAHSYAYYHALLAMISKKSVGWKVTNSKKVSVSGEFLHVTMFAAVYLFAYISLIALSIKKDGTALLDPNYLLIIYWIGFNLISISYILFQFYNIVRKTKTNDSDFTWWQIKTAGSYVAMVVAIVTFISVVPGIV
jgi:cellulose synthase (UDP-forming)